MNRTLVSISAFAAMTAGLSRVVAQSTPTITPFSIDCGEQVEWQKADGENKLYPRVLDAVIPADMAAQTVYFELHGGSGERARVTGVFALGGSVNVSVSGGVGAQVGFRCMVGFLPGMLAPGGKIRAVIGDGGGTENGGYSYSNAYSGGRGGGATALLYLPPGSPDTAEGWVLLGVAGGGGGAFIEKKSGFVNKKSKGEPASTSTSGTQGRESGGAGGTDGGPGSDGPSVPSAGGYGAEGLPDTYPLPGAWDYGFGGSGDGNSVSGGGGGGGAGYSGGGGGGKKGGGGGGGSYANTDYATDISIQSSSDNDVRGKVLIRPEAALNDTPDLPLEFAIGWSIDQACCTGTAAVSTCGIASSYDRWYRVTNPDNCPQKITLSWSNQQVVSVHPDGQPGNVLKCSDTSPLVIELQSGQSALIRVGTDGGNVVFSSSGVVADADGDGVCDSEDQCPTGNDTADCNDNGIVDCLELMATQTDVLQRFSADGDGHPYAANGSAYLDPAPLYGYGRLTDGPAGQTGSIVFEPASYASPSGSTATSNFEVAFRFRMTSNQSGEGIAFSVFPKFANDASVNMDSRGVGPLSSFLKVFFSTYDEVDHTPNYNRITIRGRDGAGDGTSVQSPFDMDNGVIYHARIRYLNKAVSVWLAPEGGSEVPVVDAYPLPSNWPTLSESWFGFGASTTYTTSGHWIDDVRITDFDNGNDCDGDGIPDACDDAGCDTPLNDTCDSALAVSEGSYPFDLSFAHYESSTGPDCEGTKGHDLWFAYTATGNGVDCEGVVDMIFNIDGFGPRPNVSVYDSCGGIIGGCGDPDPHRATKTMRAGETVLIRVSADSGATLPMTGTLSVSAFKPEDLYDHDGVVWYCDNCDYVANPDQADTDGDGIGDACEVINPTCDTALDLFDFFQDGVASVNYDLRGAQDGPDEPSCTTEGSENLSAWFSVTPTLDYIIVGQFTHVQGLPPEGRATPASLKVYDTCNGTELACVESVADGEPLLETMVPVTPGVPILIRVASRFTLYAGAYLALPAHGTFVVNLDDQDGDGVPNNRDQCPGFPDNIDLNNNGVPDGCDSAYNVCGPADLNGDGLLDNGDIALFIDLFLGGSPFADINGDGFLDNGDISDFIQAFLAGCP